MFNVYKKISEDDDEIQMNAQLNEIQLENLPESQDISSLKNDLTLD